MRAACIQLRSGTEIEPNLKRAGQLIRQAARGGAAFIATPEMTHILQRSSRDLFAVISEESSDKGVAFFSALAGELGIHLLIGSLAIKIGPNRAANRAYLFGPDGQIKTRYDKIHMFDVTVSEQETWRESKIYEKGDKAVLTNIETAKLGLSICYDVRFPALYRHYAQQGAHILAVPAAFTKPTGRAHWETLLRARAIETGSFVIAPAQGGKHADGRSTWGHSMIIGPWGEIRAHLDNDDPGIIFADIEIEDVHEARQRIPAWQYDAEYDA